MGAKDDLLSKIKLTLEPYFYHKLNHYRIEEQELFSLLSNMDLETLISLQNEVLNFDWCSSSSNELESEMFHKYNIDSEKIYLTTLDDALTNKDTY